MDKETHSNNRTQGLKEIYQTEIPKMLEKVRQGELSKGILKKWPIYLAIDKG